LFHLTTKKVPFRWFGVVESKVQQNLTIILEPDLYDQRGGLWGVHPDQSRNRLIFTGGGEKGVDLPLSDWGLEFADRMPEDIRAAIQRARGEKSGSLQDEEYRKRLQDKFGSRWRSSRLVQADTVEHDVKPATLESDTVNINDVMLGLQGNHGRTRHRSTRTVQVVRMRAIEGGESKGIERQAPADVPKYRYVAKETFTERWHLAAWVPNDPDGPVVVLNGESEALEEAIRHHQEQYPDVYAEEVAKTVMDVYGEVAVCKIAHSQKLATHVPEQDLDTYYRNEQTLTVALMGLLAEDAVIAQRLGRLGRKKPAA
jgi:hypothetical protein